MPLKQPAPSAPAKKKPAADVQIGGVFGYPTSFLQPTKAQQSKAKAKLKAKHEAALIKAQNDKVFEARQSIATKSAINSQVAAKAGLLPVTKTPFGGGTGAKDKFEEDATAKVQLAKSRKAELAQGGLLDPKQALREALAMHHVGASRSLRMSDKDQLPPDLTQLQPHKLKPRPGVAIGAPPAPPEGRGGGASGGETKHKDGGGLLGDITGAASSAAKYADNVLALPTSVHNLKEEAIRQAVPLGYLTRPLGKVATDAADLARGRIAQTPHSLPHIDVTDLLTPEAQAAGKGQRIYLDDLTDSQRYGDFALGAATRKEFVNMAKANGYPIQDAPQWNDALLAQYAFNKNTHSITGFIRNFASDVGNQAALAAAPSMLASAAIQSVQQHSLKPLATLGDQFVKGAIAPAPFIGDRPWLENLYEKPLTTGLTVAPIAKGAGIRLGKLAGLEATREVTLPTRKAAVDAGLREPGQEKVTLPASQHPLGRAAQVLHDRILAMGEHPDERTKRQQSRAIVAHPGSEIKRQVADLPSKIGHKLEGRIERGVLHDKHMQARLEAGHEPFLAHQALLESYRKLPFVKDLVTKGWGGKEHSIEDIFYHEGQSNSPKQTALMYREFAKRSEQDAARLEQLSAEAKVNAEMARGHGDLARAKDLEEQAAKYDQHVKDIRGPGGIIEKQLEAAKRSDASPHELGNADEDVQRAVDAMRHASKMSGDILQKQGLIDEKGRLWGDWQYKISAIDATEGPGTELGGEHGTPAYHIVQKLVPARDAFMAARADFHGVDPGEAQSIAASKDVHEPLAEHAMGRWRMASALRGVIERKHEAVQSRVNEFDPLAAGEAGLHPAMVRDAVTEAKYRAEDARQRIYNGSEKAHDNLLQDASALEGKERAAHSEKANSTLARREADLKAAKATRQPPHKIAELQRAVDTAQGAADSAFKPSRELLDKLLQIEKSELHGDLGGLRPQDLDKIIRDKFRNGLTPQQHNLVRAAMQHEIDVNSKLGDVWNRTNQIVEGASKDFRDFTGKSVEQGHAMDLAGAHYLRAMRALRDDQEALGNDPFHMHLHKPDTEYGLQPVQVSGGKQFEEADYTHDMHFLVARDLEGLSRKQVEGQMFRSLEDEPYFIGKPPSGSKTPPGFIAVDRALWDNLLKVAKDPEQVKELQKQFDELGKTSHAGATIEGDDTVLISRHLKEWLQAELKRDDPNREINTLLQATNAYRRWMLFSLPRTYVNNAVGNPILAVVMGARMRHFFEARNLLKQHPERLPNTLRRRGTNANIMERPGAKMTGWQQMWRSMNTFQEDLGNMMVYLMHAEKNFKATHPNDLGFMRHIDKQSDIYVGFLEDAARGKNPDAAAWGKKSAEAFGDMYRTLKHDNTLASLFLFHRWVGHMIHLTMWTLPTKYPGRALFLQDTANLADQYRKEHGVFPDWAEGMIPLWSKMEKAGEGMQSATWALSGSGINPFATPGQTFDLGTPDQPKFPLQSAIAANINPGIRVLGEFGTGHRFDTLEPFKDWHGHAINALDAHVLAQGIIANTPIINTLFPRAGLSDDTIQIPNPLTSWHPRYQAAAKYDDTMRSPQAMGRGLLSDWLIRIAAGSGAPIRPIDAAGYRAQDAAQRTIAWQQQQLAKRTRDAAAEEEAANIRLYKMDRAAWNKKFGVKP